MSDALDDDEKAQVPTESHKANSAALDHAWDWFKCHADQRIALFRFYVIVVGGLAAAVGVLHQQKENLLCALLSIFAAFVCFCFMRLDRRTSDLVRLGEHAMTSEQKRLTAYTGNDHFDIALKSQKLTGSWPYTYGQVIRALLSTSAGLFVLFAIVSATEAKHVAMVLHDWACTLLSR